MSSYNKVILLGHTCRDIEMRYSPSGTAIGNFSIAINRKWRTENGDLQEKVSFVDCTVFGKTAETMAQYVLKGHAVHIDGRLEQDVWQDKQTGQNRSKLKVIVESFQFLNQREGDGTPRPAAAPAAARRPATGEAPQQHPPDENQLDPTGDVPF